MALFARHIDAIHARRLIIDGFGGAAHHAALHQRTVQRERVKPVGARLFARHFPVARHDEALRRAQQFQPAVSAAEQLIHVIFDIAQIFVKRRAIDIPGRENQPAIQVHACLFQAQRRLVDIVAVHLFLFDRRADEIAVRTERPAVVDALVDGLVARFAQAHPHAAMRADVERDMHIAFASARDDHIVFGHVTDDEIASFGNFALMPQEEPGPGENALHFVAVQLFVAHHAQRDLVGVAHDQVIDRGAVVQDQACLLQHGAFSSAVFLVESHHTH